MWRRETIYYRLVLLMGFVIPIVSCSILKERVQKQHPPLKMRPAPKPLIKATFVPMPKRILRCTHDLLKKDVVPETAFKMCEQAYRPKKITLDK